MGLVRSLEPWGVLLTYCNNQLRKYIALLLRLGHSPPVWCLCQKLSLSLFTVNKLLPHRSPEWSSLVSGPKAKSSSSDIMNPTSFTISYKNNVIFLMKVGDLRPVVHVFQEKVYPVCERIATARNTPAFLLQDGSWFSWHIPFSFVLLVFEKMNTIFFETY